MTKQTKQYKITILDNEYSLVSDESEQHVHSTVEYVNLLMKVVQEKSRLADQTKVAVLAALQIASELLRLQEEKVHNQQEYSVLIDTIEKQLQSSRG
jgi:cell division protein ZapA